MNVITLSLCVIEVYQYEMEQFQQRMSVIGAIQFHLTDVSRVDDFFSSFIRNRRRRIGYLLTSTVFPEWNSSIALSQIWWLE